jgi:hypothetical protein
MRYKKTKSIKYFFIIVAILVIVFLSQQDYSREFGKSLAIKASESISGYWAKGASWAADNVYSKASEEVQNRGEVIKNEINLEKEKVSENISEKIKNYFSGVVDSVIHPTAAKEENINTQNCQPAETLNQAPIYTE